MPSATGVVLGLGWKKESRQSVLGIGVFDKPLAFGALKDFESSTLLLHPVLQIQVLDLKDRLNRLEYPHRVIYLK
jgi:hypothetical protein